MKIEINAPAARILADRIIAGLKQVGNTADSIGRAADRVKQAADAAKSGSAGTPPIRIANSRTRADP